MMGLLSLYFCKFQHKLNISLCLEMATLRYSMKAKIATAASVLAFLSDNSYITLNCR